MPAALAYVGLESADPLAWAAFAEEILGARLSEPEAGTQFVRLDERHHRLAVLPGADGKLAFLGWDMASAEAFDQALQRLRRQEVPYERATPQECQARHVRDLARLPDPDGNLVELVYGCEAVAGRFTPSRQLSAIEGLGHIVIGSPKQAEAERFYREVIGLRVSDYVDMSTPQGVMSGVFLHADDGRHHSLAIMNLGNGLRHLMVEVSDIDDVGVTLDLCRARGVQVLRGLGRHSNDRMISFYMIAPGGVQLEYGCGGRRLDDATWRVTRLISAELWGHAS